MNVLVRIEENLTATFLPHRRARRLIDLKLDAKRAEAPLSASDAKWLDTHLGSCAACAKVAERREALVASMQALRGEKAPLGFAGRVLLAARTRPKEAPRETREGSFLPISQLVGGGALLALVLIAVGFVIGVAPKLGGGGGKVESLGGSVALDTRDAPDFLVRSPGTGVARVRSQVTAIVRAHGGSFSDERRAIVARIPRAELIGVTQDLAKQGTYKMSKSGAESELRPSADTVVIRFELE